MELVLEITVEGPVLNREALLRGSSNQNLPPSILPSVHIPAHQAHQRRHTAGITANNAGLTKTAAPGPTQKCCCGP